jgi:iron complex outermembrane receptor protein
MNSRLTAAFLGASLSVLAAAASAQAAPAVVAAATGASGADTATLGEIVVTARRKSESAQNAPLTVNAVKGESLQKLNIQQFADIQSIVPGVNLNFDEHGSGSAVSIRGVNFTVATASQPTVALYVNEAPVEANFIFHSMYDVGQVEVLKGPQGTLRGVSAPSGAITITTRRPDLGSYGGYIDGTYAEQNGRDVQGAINIPIIKDVLAIRGAAIWDQTNLDAVTSVNSPSKPREINTSERISAIFQPIDNLTANVTYQHIDSSTIDFTQVIGAGPGPFSIGSTPYNTTPANTVDPALTPSQRRAVSDQAAWVKMRNEIVTGNIDYRFMGQHLSYDGSYALLKFKSFAGSHGDTANLVPGFDFGDYGLADEMSTTHELRLASDPSPDRHWDYTVGAFYRWDHVCCSVNEPQFLPGAFGPSSGAVTNVPNPAYVLPINVTYPGAVQETSLFGGLTLHLPFDTELSGGVRHIWSVFNSTTTINTGAALADAGSLAFYHAHYGVTAFSQLGLQNSTYSGDCDSVVNATHSVNPVKYYETPTVYNVSLSHKVTRDFMVYATTGTSFRPAVEAIGVAGALASAPPTPAMNTLINHPSESATSYEVGFKSTWFERRARLNVALYRQDFDGLVVIGPPVNYWNTATNRTSNFAFAQSVKALVQGFDIDTGLQITHDWSVSLGGSYADGKNLGTPIPCVGTAALNAGNLVNMCSGKGVSTSNAPLWSATLQSEYTHPVGDSMDGFIRGLATYYPQNKRVETFFTAGAYALVNLYGGIRSHNGAWEISVFAKNVFNTAQLTNVGSIALSSGVSATELPGLHNENNYQSATVTPPRQVGVNIHYAWGSR